MKIGCTSANRKLLSFAFGLHDFSTPTQGPSPLQGKGCNRSHPLARSLRYPRPIKESRGDSLRNKVAIVCAGFARHSTESLLKSPEQFCDMIVWSRQLGMMKLMTSCSTFTLKGPTGEFIRRPSMPMRALSAFSTMISVVLKGCTLLWLRIFPLKSR